MVEWGVELYYSEEHTLLGEDALEGRTICNASGWVEENGKMDTREA
jgi:hypothetical protein